MEEQRGPRGRQASLIRVDQREVGSGVPESLATLDGVILRIEQLDVADYVLSQRVAVERKSAADLAASILDRRLFAQVEQLKMAYEQVIYLIEGESLYEASHVHPNAMRGALSFLVILQGVSLIRTESPQDSALFLATMARHAQHGLGYEPSTHPKRRSLAPQLQLRYLVEDLPGVGPKTAQALLERFGSLRNMFNASEEELYQVPGIGPKRARQLHDLFNLTYDKQSTP